MKNENERLQNLDEENFYLIIFSGTRMPISPRFIKVVMFNDMFSVETEEGKVENIENPSTVELVKELILSSIPDFEIMNDSLTAPVKSSYNYRFQIKINNEHYNVDRNALNEKAKNIYHNFETKLFDIINVDKYI